MLQSSASAEERDTSVSRIGRLYIMAEGDSRSQLGYGLRLNPSSGMIYSRPIRDTAVSLSSAEAELRVLKKRSRS